MLRLKQSLAFVVSVALAGVARGEATLPPGFIDEVVVGGLNVPVALAEAPDGSFLILEQYAGIVRRVRAKQTGGAALLTVPDVNTSGGNERGLLSVALDPDYPSRPFVYLYYTALGNVNKLVRYTLTPGASLIDEASRVEILNDIPDNAWNHNGGSLRFGIDGLLFLSLGDDANSCAAQDLTDLRGMILRLDVRGIDDRAASVAKRSLAPPNNPFVALESDNAALVYHYGLRNPFRFDIDAANGDLLIADVGLLDFEEIDFAPAGAGGGLNFGWPFHEGPASRSQPGCVAPSDVTFVEPVAFYDRTGFQASVISLCVYRPPANAPLTWPAEYHGDYFYSDYFQGFVRRLARDSADTWSAAPAVVGQPNAADWGAGVSHVADALVGSDGALYYLRQFNDSFDPESGELRRIRYQRP